MSDKRRRKRPCPYCGVITESVACPQHRELARTDAELHGSGPPLTDQELGIAEAGGAIAPAGLDSPG